VSGAATTTTVTAVPASTTYGQSVTFKATVAVVPPGVGTPVGTVDFAQNGTAIATCAGVALNGSGVATCTTASLPAGADSIKGTYNPTNSNFATSNGTLAYTVNPAATTTTVTAVPTSTSTYGQSVTFTAAVAVVAPGVGTPVGTVDFTQNGSAIATCTAVAVNGSGNAVCTTASLPAGADAIKGTYNPTGTNFTASSGNLAYTVTPSATATNVTAVPASSSPLGQSVTLTAAVTPVAPGGGTPVGTVSFTENGTPIATCTAVALASGSAACTTSSLPAGSDAIVAVYTPTGGNYTGSTGNLTYTVVAPPTIAKAFNPVTITLGATSTLTFTINNPAANTVAITSVGFTDDLQGGLTVPTASTNACNGTLTTTNPSTIVLSNASVAPGTGGNPGVCTFSVTVTGGTGGLNIANTTLPITSGNGGTGNTSNTATITVQDYMFTAVDSVATFVQGANPVVAASVTITPEFTYAGTVSSAGCAPAGFLCTFTATTGGNNLPVSIAASASTLVGPYTPVTLSASGTAIAPGPAIVHPALLTSAASFAVECTYSLGNGSLSATTPTYTPSIPGPYSLFVTEVAGGSNCPWGPSANAPLPPAATATSGITIISGSTGQVSALGTGSPLSFNLTPPILPTATAPQFDQITVNYFQTGVANDVGSSTYNVTQETPVTATSNTGVTSSSTLAVSASAAGNLNNQSGSTLTFAQVQGLNASAVATICNAENVQSDGTLVPDPAGLNYGISCAPLAGVPLTGSAVNFTLQVTIPAGLNAANTPRHEHGKPILLYAFLLGLPAMVFVGTGTFAFGSQRQRLLLRRLTTGAALLLVLTLLVLLPACGGGFQANFGGTKTASYQLTVMGYVTDGANTVQGAEIFTVPLTILH